NLSGYSAIDVNRGINLFLGEEGIQNIKVSAQQNLLDIVQIWVSGSTLHISLKKEWIVKNSEINVFIPISHLKQLNKLSASGGSDVMTKHMIKNEAFALHASGGTDVHLALEVNQLECKNNGGSDVTLSGRARSMEVHSSGGSDLNARELRSEICYIYASGGSDSEIQASKEIHGSLSGAADVNYSGNPAVVDVSVSGSADLKKR
ncbi:MAG: head GIN domain-containing protein, partial [Bacteroidota bacterium]